MASNSSLSGWKILVIDDAEDNVAVVEAVLQHYGATVFSAASGPAGLWLMEEIEPNLVLLDIAMPDFSGWDTLKSIRDNPRYAQTRVIAITAHSTQAERERARQAGFDGFIAKPFKVSEFLNQIKAVIDGTDNDF